jgi:hypothetical protein
VALASEVTNRFSELQSFAAAIQSFVTVLAVVIGGIWAFWKFVVQGEGRAKLQIELAIRQPCVHQNKRLVELVAYIENKGKVRHWVKDFYFNFYSLQPSDQLIENDSRNSQVLFQNNLKDKIYWIPNEWMESFIEPGIRQEYTYITSVPLEATSVLLYSEFRYSDEVRGFHTVQRVFPLLPVEEIGREQDAQTANGADTSVLRTSVPFIALE